ncbi:MAG: HEAT repeat domain-containing protein, partial [Calditrichaceae bacterium]
MDGEQATQKLLTIAEKNKDPEIRKDAIFWLSQNSDSDEVVQALQKYVLNDNDAGVQEKAVFALSQLDNNRGVPILIDIAKNSKDVRIRKKAIFWLGQSDDERASEALEEILYQK